MEREKSLTAKLLRKINNKVAVTVREHEMINENDHILIGLSGGKDSMILLETLAERQASLPYKFEITAAHIQVESIDYRANIEEMKRICSNLKVNFIQKRAEIDENESRKKGICFLCSWNRRKALFDLTRELNCNILAMGHHRNDALETLLLNMIYHGSISSLPYKLKMFEGRVHLIRPLMDIEESLLADYASLREYQTEGITCSHEKISRRDDIKHLLTEIEKIHGPARINMFRSMDKIFEQYLPQKKARIS